MSKEFWLEKQNSETCLHDYEADAGLRIYQSSPEQIAIQVRSCGPVTVSGKGKKRPAFSMVQLDAREIDLVINELKKLKREIT